MALRKFLPDDTVMPQPAALAKSDVMPYVSSLRVSRPLLPMQATPLPDKKFRPMQQNETSVHLYCK